MAKEKTMQGTADFDWEALQLDGYSQVERSEMSDIYEKTLTSIDEKEVIQGKVVHITKKEVIINIGYKSEGVIASNEFRYNPDLKIGDIVDVYVECTEDKTGQLVVSHKTARMHSAWIRVNEVLKTGEVITGHVKCRTKGGLIVDVFGIEAFLPKMKESGHESHIVATCSTSGFIAYPMLSLYSASKFGIRGLMTAMRAELTHSNVGVSIVCPGEVTTNIINSTFISPNSSKDTQAEDQDPNDLLEEAAADAKNTFPISPNEAAEAIFAGIQQKEFYIFTHKGYKRQLEEISNEYLEAFDRAMFQ